MRRVGLPLARMIGMREMVSVVAVTAFMPSRQMPEPDKEWVDLRIAIALDVLNEFLIALGVQARDARVGPITRSDLPPAVPMIIEEQPVPDGQRVGAHHVFNLHPWMPSGGTTTRDPDLLMAAATLFRAAREGTTAWFPVLELGHLARRDAVAGRFAASIVSAATSIEILLSTVVREVGPIRGWDDGRISGALESGFKNIATVHVPKLLGISVDIDDVTTAWGRWWQAGYLIRNEVVHAGRRPTDAQAQEAVWSAMELIAEVGRLIEADAGLGDLGFGLPTGVSR